MKVLYIESKRKNLELDISKEEIDKLPKSLFLAYSIQYKDLALRIKKELEKNNIKITSFSQVLGCSKINPKDPILFIGSGEFHLLNLLAQTSYIIYTIEQGKINEIQKSEIENLKEKRKTALIKFLKADKIGILVSTKIGQENLKQALFLKEKLEKEQKKAFVFISDRIDTREFENFDIDSWVNTACPRIDLDNTNIIGIKEIKT
jgi:2-(3-amino-3-carboxypropyl)histidine synthase